MPPKQLGARLQQILGDARALQHHAHEDEERNGEQHVVGHDAVDARRQRREEGNAEMACEDADAEEDQRCTGERERHRKAAHQGRDGADEHDDAEDSALLTGVFRSRQESQAHAAMAMA